MTTVFLHDVVEIQTMNTPFVTIQHNICLYLLEKKLFCLEIILSIHLFRGFYTIPVVI